MFIFKTGDGESGKNRRRRFLKELAIYAFSKFKTKKEVASYLGISRRHLQDIIKIFPELYQYRKTWDDVVAKEWYSRSSVFNLIPRRKYKMDLIKYDMESPKEIFELGQAIGNMIEKLRSVLDDGFQPEEDIPEVVLSSIKELSKAVDGLSRVPSEFKESALLASLGLINPIAKSLNKIMK